VTEVVSGREGEHMGGVLRTVRAITLFVEDLDATRAFYERAFEASPIFQDDDSAVFDLANTLVNLLDVAAAHELVAPMAVGAATTGARVQLTVQVDDVDVAARGLAERGVDLLNGPVDRPWGVRTAAFADPAGHVWEIAQPLGD
jgi:catechol 2,3-dioxygenase-like lactoylglutathione lyase family enzyme